MKLTNKKTIIFLYILTLSTALVSTYFYGWKFLATSILLLSGIKFILVTFQFMEMKKANSFWKGLIVIYLSIFILVIGIIMY